MSAGDFSVSGTTADVTAPVVDAASLKVSATECVPGDSVTVSVRVTDDVAMDYVSICYNMPQTKKTYDKTMTFNSTTGFYEATIPIDTSFEEGVWKINNIYARDKAHNYTLLQNKAFAYSGGIDLSAGDFSVSSVLAESVSIDCTETMLSLHGTRKLTASVLPENAAKTSVSWESSDPAVVAVENGLVTGIAPGTATVTATTIDGTDLSAQCEITVVEKTLVTDISLDQTEVVMEPEDTVSLSASVQPENAEQRMICWKSSNPEVATVSDGGKIVAIQPGKTMITASAQDGSNVSASCAVTVKAIGETDPIPYAYGLSWNSYFANGQIYKTVAFKYGAQLGTEPYAFVIEAYRNNLSLGSITKSESGTIELEGNAFQYVGTYTFYVTVTDAHGKSSRIKMGESLTITNSSLSINSDGSTRPKTFVERIDLPSAITLEPGMEKTIAADVSPDDANNKAVKWKSSNKNVATVSSDGQITAHSEGSANIFAISTDGSNIRGTCTVTVTNKHTPAIDAAVAATCTQTGLSQGSHCSVCGLVIKAQEIVPVIAHTPAVDAAVAATCTQTGLTQGSHCSVCGAVIEAQETIAATGHTPVIDPEIPASYVKTGLSEGSHCAVCRTILKPQETIPFKSIELSVGSNRNQSVNINEAIRFSSDNTFTVKSWKSSSTKIATVSNGLVTGKAEGTAKITLEYTNRKKASVSVKVVDPYKPTKVALNKSGTQTLSLGETLTLSPSLSPATAQASYSWKSSSAKVAKVSGGVVTPVREGTATITVTATRGKVKKTASVKIRVVEPNQ